MAFLDGQMEKEVLCYNITLYYFTVMFEQFNESLLNKSIKLLYSPTLELRRKNKFYIIAL